LGSLQTGISMASTDETLRSTEGRGGSLLYNPVFRAILLQVLVFGSLCAFLWWIIRNTQANLARAGRDVSFDFLHQRAGFDVGQSLIAYTSDSTQFDALIVGLLNTLLVAFTGIVTATII